MGKTKVRIIDDAQALIPDIRHQTSDKEDVLVARLKEELGVEETKEVKSTSQKEKVEAKKKEVKLKTKPRSKKYQQAISQVDRGKNYPLPEAVELAQKTSYTKFPGTLEVHINTTAKNIKGCEPNGQVIHLAIGKVNQSTDEITANIKSLYQTIGKSKISKITLSATMGPGVKVDLATI